MKNKINNDQHLVDICTNKDEISKKIDRVNRAALEI